MKIGIDASRAFISNRTGIEKYSFQVIKNLTSELRDCQVFLYVKHGQKTGFDFPDNWKIREIKLPYLWTQLGLSFEMLMHPVDVLFVPAHIIPWITPKKTIVSIHGLEYEFCPEAYSFWERIYMRFFIRRSCRKASKIISVSENTKKDLMKLYNVPEEKIEVVYEGVDKSQKSKVESQKPNFKIKNILGKKFILFVGRIEERKNISGVIQAFEMLKGKYNLSHKLVLAGKPGFGYDKIKNELVSSRFKEDIIELGYITDEEREELYKEADVFLFPSFYEGFGLPILEAQSVGTPVVASRVSSMPEVAGEGAVLVDPNGTKDMAEQAFKLISDQSFRDDIIEKGYENVKRFSWEKCAQTIGKIVVNS